MIYDSIDPFKKCYHITLGMISAKSESHNPYSFTRDHFVFRLNEQFAVNHRIHWMLWFNWTGSIFSIKSFAWKSIASAVYQFEIIGDYFGCKFIKKDLIILIAKMTTARNNGPVFFSNSIFFLGIVVVNHKMLQCSINICFIWFLKLRLEVGINSMLYTKTMRYCECTEFDLGMLLMLETFNNVQTIMVHIPTKNLSIAWRFIFMWCMFNISTFRFTTVHPPYLRIPYMNAYVSFFSSRVPFLVSFLFIALQLKFLAKTPNNMPLDGIDLQSKF